MSIAPLCRIKDINWVITSKTDPRWNGSGTTDTPFLWNMVIEARNHIKRMEKKYGKRPKDLIYTYEEI